MADTTTVAYLAGFFDGEGCITCLQYKHEDRDDNYGIRAQLSQNDRRPLDLAMETFPGGRLYPRKNAKVLNVQWHGLNAVDMLEQMLPFLLVKRDEARLAIEFGNIMRQIGPGQKHKPEAKARQGEIKHLLRELKYHG